TRGGQNVVNVRATDERRRDLALALRRDEAQPRAFHRIFDIARRHINTALRAAVADAEAVSNDALPFRNETVSEPRAVLVVRVDYRDARTLAEASIEESQLGFEVFLHRAVVVEVVARQVREGRDFI